MPEIAVLGIPEVAVLLDDLQLHEGSVYIVLHAHVQRATFV